MSKIALTKEQILQVCKDSEVEFVRFQFTDLCGVLKAVTTPVSQLENALENNVWFDGSSIEGFTGIQESDMYLKPDLATFAVIPWTRDTDSPVARFICDVYMPDGSRFEGDPRYILQKQVARLEAMGMKYFVGPELEFFLFEKKQCGKIGPYLHDTAGYFDQEMDKGTFIRKDMVHAMHEFGIEVEALHHEVALSQHEIDFRFGEPVTTADNAMTLKFVVKSIANMHDLHATFMPKPIAGINGSGMHVHQSVFEGSSNKFYDEASSDKLSTFAKHFMAGQLAHIKATTAVTNPLVNSYKRLVAGYEAPVYIAWGETNRSALIRIPRFKPGQEKAARFELRSPDPSANPYLAFAVLLAAGIDGIEKKLECPKAVSTNLYEKSLAELKEMGVDHLPQSISEAIANLEKDEVVKSALGEHTVEAIKALRMAESDAYRIHVSEWEVNEYMSKY
jgi:glutamine synthetase